MTRRFVAYAGGLVFAFVAGLVAASPPLEAREPPAVTTVPVPPTGTPVSVPTATPSTAVEVRTVEVEVPVVEPWPDSCLRAAELLQEAKVDTVSISDASLLIQDAASDFQIANYSADSLAMAAAREEMDAQSDTVTSEALGLSDAWSRYEAALSICQSDLP